MLYPDGQKYEGNWKYNEKDGKGITTLVSGIKIRSRYKADNPNGPSTVTYPDGKEKPVDFVQNEDNEPFECRWVKT